MAKIQWNQVINAALTLLDEAGLEAITTRKLAQKLGVESAMLYWHFRNKASLLEEMAVIVLAGHHSPPLTGGTAERADRLANNARSFRRASLAHRNGVLLRAGTTPAWVGGETFYPKVAYPMWAGFSEAKAVMVLLTTGEYTLGCMLEEQPRTGRHGDERLFTPSIEINRIDAFTHQHPDTCFEFGLSLIMEGLLR